MELGPFSLSTFPVRASNAALDVRNGRAGRKSSDTCHRFPCATRTTQSPVLGASMPHVLSLGARKTVFSTYVHGLRAYHALNQYRIRYEDMRCKSLVLAPLRLFGLSAVPASSCGLAWHSLILWISTAPLHRLRCSRTPTVPAHSVVPILTFPRLLAI